MKKRTHKNGLYWILMLSVLMVGGFWNWSAALLGVAVYGAAVYRAAKTKKCVLLWEQWVWLLLLLQLTLFLSLFTAVDRGMALIGAVRFLPVTGWLFLCMQYSEEEREQALEAIPHAGCLMAAVGLPALLVPAFTRMFWSAQRLGGFFQYSNTCAVFFLLGLLLISGREEKKDKIQWCVLYWGILLTGSRTVMLLLLPILLLLFIKGRKPLRKLIAANLAVAFVGASLMVLLTGSYQNLARLATVFSSNSTFYGRLLYWQDALPLIAGHPLGLGWRGYYYMQPAVQSGVYSTLYVHNDLLQSFLDGGWVSGAAFLLLMLYQVRHSRRGFLLAVLFLHSLVDFDMQYLSIWFTAVLLFGFGTGKEKAREVKRAAYTVCMSAAALVCAWFFIPLSAMQAGYCVLAVYLYPGYTDAKEILLRGMEDSRMAGLLADEVLEGNPYASFAWHAKAMAAWAEGDMEAYAENMEEMLAVRRYDIAQYREYAFHLDRLKEEAQEKGDEEAVKFCEERYRQIEKMLEKTRQGTSALAFMIRDRPEFSVEENVDSPRNGE